MHERPEFIDLNGQLATVRKINSDLTAEVQELRGECVDFEWEAVSTKGIMDSQTGTITRLEADIEYLRGREKSLQQKANLSEGLGKGFKAAVAGAVIQDALSKSIAKEISDCMGTADNFSGLASDVQEGGILHDIASRFGLDIQEFVKGKQKAEGEEATAEGGDAGN